MRRQVDFNTLVMGGSELLERVRISKRDRLTRRRRLEDRVAFRSPAEDQEGKSANDPAPPGVASPTVPIPEDTPLAFSSAVTIPSSISTSLTIATPSPMSNEFMRLITTTEVAAVITVAIILVLFGFSVCCCRRILGRNRQIASRQLVPRHLIWGPDDDSPVLAPRSSMECAPLAIQRSNRHSSLTLPPITNLNLESSTTDSVFNKPKFYSTSTISKPSPLMTRTSYHMLERHPSAGSVMNSRVFIRPLRTSEIGFAVAKGEGVWLPQAHPLTRLPPSKSGMPENIISGIQTKTLSSIPDNRTLTSASPQILNKGGRGFNPLPTCLRSTSGQVEGRKISNLDTTDNESTLDFGHEISFNLTQNSSPGGLRVPSPSQMRLDAREMFVDDSDSVSGVLARWQDPLTWAKDQTRLNNLRAMGKEEDGRF